VPAIAQPHVIVNHVGILKQALQAAFTSAPASPAATTSLLARTAPVARRGTWEKYKTSQDFDGTAQHPWWLESASLARPG
jgi:hypothetical protein